MVTRVRRTASVEKILDAARSLFYAHGLRGVGMDQVIAEAGVAKSTMYAHFPTKGDLVAAYLTATDDSWMDQLQTAAEQAGPDPAEQLVGLFDALLNAFERHGFFGCPFISAAVETSLDSQAREIAIAHTRRRQEWLTTLAAATGAPEPERLAWHIGLLVDGAMAAGRLLQDRAVVEEAKGAARRLVDEHTAA
ncbi:TetR/AcrR family transcriptional regulator [Streptomyces sp. TS71-3]|uniref:TetR/AcrR family transcriptional regulator n=1 Tax=Streptomyces sp. TS71-3 TaxID=2733862 RepID=UPI001B27348F|nr:TetR/AcrR family transcriptional regulator [Streptomyces sp. TS71-3]GHJ42641.1 TetR family transcriptional regulator [Streptomyces sp. TS71-3]